MRSKLARSLVFASSVSGALIVLGAGHMPLLAQDSARSYQVISTGSTGLVAGQKLRYTWANLTNPDGQAHTSPEQLSVRLLGPDGTVIAQVEAPAVGAGKFQVFEFHRDQITRAGESNTGRLQVRLEAKLSGSLKWGDIVLKRGSKAFDDALELVDALGRTSASSKPKEIVVVGTKIPAQPDAGDAEWIDVGSGSTGIVPTQTLRVSVLNPMPKGIGDGRRYKMSFALVILDADGRVIADGGETVLGPGEFQWFDFRHAALAQRGEPGTVRMQVRVRIERRFFPGIAARLSQGGFPAVLELVDDSTGRTEMLLPAIQRVPEAAARTK